MDKQKWGEGMRRIQDAKILIVDDNRELMALLKEELAAAGYERLYTAEGISSACRTVGEVSPELVILDINLPDGDGFTLFREIRKQSEAPVLFLSARDADSDRLFGLGLGADDYMTKPFLMQELLLRVQLILRRFYRGQLQRDNVIRLGKLRIDLNDAVVTGGGAPATLTATERAILQKLSDNRGHIVTYDALCEAVWGSGYYGYENSLNVHIRHLREKIEENPSQPQWLLTARGLGYKLRKEETG